MKTDYKKPVEIAGVNNITVSGRIATGKSTLASHLSQILGWELMDGGKIFRKYANEYGFHITEKEKIPDAFDKAFEEKTEYILKNEKHYIFQSHLAGFIAQGIEGAYKILVECVDENGEDVEEIRVDRIMNRDIIPAEDAIKEVREREVRLLKKFKKLYVPDDPNWIYWDRKYYDLVVNTYSLNQEEAVKFVLKSLNIPL